MTTGPVSEITNEIETKLIELQQLKRDLTELEQDLKEEVERTEGKGCEAKYGKSVKCEEIEWDIYLTEKGIKCISEQVEALKEQLDELSSFEIGASIANE